MMTMLEDLRVETDKTGFKMNIGKTEMMTNILKVTNYQLPESDRIDIFGA